MNPTDERPEVALDLYWIPLGAGASVVRASGRAYEMITALLRRRQHRDLYHSVLIAHTPDGPVVIEMAPVPDDRGWEDRGVVADGAVGARSLGRFRTFRYEIRRWPNGLVPDLNDAVSSPVRITNDPDAVQRVLDLVQHVPTPVWGATSPGPATCGTRTRSSPGSSNAPASNRLPVRAPMTVVHPAGPPAWPPRTPRRRRPALEPWTTGPSEAVPSSRSDARTAAASADIGGAVQHPDICSEGGGVGDVLSASTQMSRLASLVDRTVDDGATAADVHVRVRPEPATTAIGPTDRAGWRTACAMDEPSAPNGDGTPKLNRSG